MSFRCLQQLLGETSSQVLFDPAMLSYDTAGHPSPNPRIIHTGHRLAW
jgi:hypothetical protein